MTDVRIGSSSLLFSFLCATCVIFSTDERGKILISCGFEIILYYLTHFLKDIAWIYKVGITEFQIKIIHIGTSGATFSVIFFCVWFFVKNSVKREEKLKVANLSIQKSNDELFQKKTDLENSNKSLEEANKKLKETARQEVFLKMGREIQAQFLPDVPKELKICNSTYHFETMYKPSNEVSGDLYDFYVQNNKIKVFHSDVIGKNVPAMMVALNIHSELKHLLKQEDEEPQKLINELNKNIYDMRARMSGCAGVYYEIDTETQKLTYVHMGYEDIYLIRGKKCIDIGSEGGPPLGGFENISYKQTSIEFKEGDMLLTISDGMSDMKNEAGKRYSQDVGVKTYIERYVESEDSKTPETLKEWLETEINRYTGDTEVYADDISVFITRLSVS